MGRAKLGMELLSSEKARYSTFQKRKKGLKKKAYELKTLCDIQVCMIIYGPKIDDRPREQEFWPPNRDEIEDLIDVYKEQSAEDRKRRSVDLSNFFQDRNRKAEEAVAKLRRKNDELKYPTWDDRYNEFSEEGVREFCAILEKKIQEVKARVEFMTKLGNPPILAAPAAMPMMDHQYMESNPNDPCFMQGLFRRRSMQFEVINSSHDAPHDLIIPIHHHHHQPFDPNYQTLLQFDENPTMANPVLMMNDNRYNTIGSGSSANSVYNPMDRQIYYDPLMGGMMENMVVASYIPRPPIGYYGSNVQPFIAPYMQYPMMASDSSQMHASQMDEFYHVSELHVKNPK